MHPSRRDLLAAGTAGLAVGALTGCSDGQAAPSGSSKPASAEPVSLQRTTRSFRGEHQPGVVDAPQQFASLVAFDLLPGQKVSALKRLMTLWTDDIDHLMAGKGTVIDFEPEMTADPASLTVTVGIGPGVFALPGITAPKPAWLGPLPAFAIDDLDDAWNGGDLLLQICADSAVTVSHARWVLTKEARSIATVRWVQNGFRPPVPSADGSMRNLFGQVDGIVQPAAESAWMGDDAPAWLRGGSTFVLRRIAMNLDTWEEADDLTRSTSLGRRQSDGAPLTGSKPTDPVDLSAEDELGLPVIDTFSHVRRAMPAHPGEQFIRRPYSYDDPPARGKLSNAGLLFIAYQASIEKQFLPVQTRLAKADLLNTWTTPIGSAVFAIPRGAKPGEVLAQDLWL